MDNSDNNFIKAFLSNIPDSILDQKELRQAFEQILTALFENLQTISDSFIQKTVKPENDKILSQIEKSIGTLKDKIIFISNSKNILDNNSILNVNNYFIENY